uniref:Uncharacterized protein n=1 Tax=Photinus pyralis TaxID=7054 RepID=A0A1Y1NC35_PHOPY
MQVYLAILVLCILHVKQSTGEIPTYIIEKWDSIMAPHKKECSEHSGIAPEDINNILRGPSIPDTKQFKNYITCIYRELGMISNDGHFQEMVIMKKADYLTYNLLKRCVGKANPEKELESKSFKLCECVVKGLEDPKFYKD